MQPAADRLALTDSGGAAGKDEKRGLEGILSVVFVTEDVAADTPHQPSVSPHQRGECLLRAVHGKALEQFPVAPSALGLRLDQSLNVAQHRAGVFAGHRFRPSSGRFYL